jgi:hypothetical protein
MEILIYVSLVVLLVLGFIFLIPRSNHKGKGCLARLLIDVSRKLMALHNVSISGKGDDVRSGGNGKVKFIFHQRYCCFQECMITLTNRAISFTMLLDYFMSLNIKHLHFEFAVLKEGLVQVLGRPKRISFSLFAFCHFRFRCLGPIQRMRYQLTTQGRIVGS